MEFLNTIRRIELNDKGIVKVYGIGKARDFQQKIAMVLKDDDVMGYLEVERVI